jgi:hypothetical protein
VHIAIEIADADRGWEAAAAEVERLGATCAALGGYVTWTPSDTFRHLRSERDAPIEATSRRLKLALDPSEVLPPL